MYIIQKDGTILIIHKYDCVNDSIYYKKIYDNITNIINMTKSKSKSK